MGLLPHLGFYLYKNRPKRIFTFCTCVCTCNVLFSRANVYSNIYSAINRVLRHFLYWYFPPIALNKGKNGPKCTCTL